MYKRVFFPLLALITTIESREWMQQRIAIDGHPPKHPRASSTDDVECFFSQLQTRKQSLWDPKNYLVLVVASQELCTFAHLITNNSESLLRDFITYCTNTRLQHGLYWMYMMNRYSGLYRLIPSLHHLLPPVQQSSLIEC